MMVETDPRELIGSIVLADYHPAQGSFQIVREKRAGKDAVFAVAFEGVDGSQRRGLLGLRWRHNSWQQCGSFMSSIRETENQEPWMTWGGWSGDSHEWALAGGWVADPSATYARLIDITGRALTDDVEQEVFLIMWKDDFDIRRARLELLDADGHVIRSGPMRRGR